MTIKEASEKLGISQQSLRLWMQSGHCPFGDAFRGRGKNYQYIISEAQLNAWIYGEQKSAVQGASAVKGCTSILSQ